MLTIYVFLGRSHFSSFSLFPPPPVNLRKVIALASVDSAVTAGYYVIRFPSSVGGFSVLDFFLRLRSLAAG